MFPISGINDFRTPMRDQSLHRGSELAPSFQLGEVLEVEVLEVLGNNLAVLGIRGSAVLAEMPGPLAPGTVVKTRVQEISPKLVLVLLQGETKPSGPVETFLRTHLPEKIPLAELIPQLMRDLPDLKRAAPDLAQSLQAALERSILSAETVKDPSFLKNWVETSGLMLEGRLANAVHGGRPVDLTTDLKAILLGVAERLAELYGLGETEGGEALLARVRAYVKNIELDQFRNVQARRDGRSIYLQIPWGAAGESAELFLHRWGEETQDEASEGEHGFRICFLLRLQGLGPLRIDAKLQGNRVSIRFEVENPESRALIGRHVARLGSRLEAQDFRVVRLDCVESKGVPRADEEEAFDFGLQEKRLIDVKA